MADKYNHKWVRLLGGFPIPATWALTVTSETTIYSESREYVDKSASWRRHEDCHKAQIKKEGWIKFMAKYVWYQFTMGYNNNPYEVEARQVSSM